MVSPDHRNTSHNQIKQPQSHMQDDQQLPCAPQALTDCMCFSSPAAITGSCRSVRDLGFRGSNVCQMSFGVCAAQISPLDILVGCCFSCVCVLLHTNHIFHLSGSVCSAVCIFYLYHDTAASFCTLCIHLCHAQLILILKPRHLGFC